MHLLIITRKVDRQDIRAGFFVDWIVAFAQEVEKVSVICLEKGDDSGLPENVKVSSLGKERGKNRLREVMRLIWLLARVVPRCDGIFVHMIPLYVFFSGPYAKVFRKPLYLWYTHGTIDWRLRLTSLFVTGYLSASMESFPLPTSKPVMAFGHALNLALFPRARSSADDDDVLTIVTVGRMTPRKNLDTLIRAVARLRERGIHTVRLKMIGAPALDSDCVYVEHLRHLVADFRLADEVIFLGAVPRHHLAREFERADVFVNLSDTHSLDKAILESMACGVIPITSNRSFRPVFGSLADELMAECTPEDVAERMIAVWGKPHEEKERIRETLREIVERNHDMKKTIPKIVGLYERERAKREIRKKDASATF